MTEPDLKAASAATYAATADHFDAPALSFWDRYGVRTISRLGASIGAAGLGGADLSGAGTSGAGIGGAAKTGSVLDACCGTGASAIPAARAVGLGGTVLGIDISEPALELARAKARAQGLSNVEFRRADIEGTGLDDGAFDAVVCVFGIFFLPDMVSGLAELWRLVRPGGQLAVTVWGPRLFEPGASAFWAAVGAERPGLVRGFQPWTRLTEPGEVTALFEQAGAATPVVEAEAGMHPIANVDDWWTIVLGTGFRATVDQLDAGAVERVRAANLAAMRGVREVETNVIYAVARKP